MSRIAVDMNRIIPPLIIASALTLIGAGCAPYAEKKLQ